MTVLCQCVCVSQTHDARLAEPLGLGRRPTSLTKSDARTCADRTGNNLERALGVFNFNFLFNEMSQIARRKRSSQHGLRNGALKRPSRKYGSLGCEKIPIRAVLHGVGSSTLLSSERACIRVGRSALGSPAAPRSPPAQPALSHPALVHSGGRGYD